MRIVYVIPGAGTSGGVAVICQHTNRLLRRGHDVYIALENKGSIDWFPNQQVPIVSLDEYPDDVDILVATGWQTSYGLVDLPAKKKFYFVQSDETRFHPEGSELINITALSYRLNFNYLTEARWIQKWLLDNFGHESELIPNGLDHEIFHATKPLEPKGKKPRILLEGSIGIPYKGMADAFSAIADLDVEVWCVSSYGKPEPGWKCDRFFERIPMTDMKSVYSSCDVLLKLSRVEGFFGPPMEMMACGGAVVVGKVTGYDEYIIDGYNALAVELGDVAAARNAVAKIISDDAFRNHLIANGFETVKIWQWEPSIDRLERYFQDILAGRRGKSDSNVKLQADRAISQTYKSLPLIRSQQILAIQVAEKEQSVQALMAQVAEKEQTAQALAAQLADINSNKTWKMALLFRQIRALIAPPNRLRARPLLPLINVIFFPFKKIKRIRRLKEDSGMLRDSGLFDPDWYLTNNPDVAQAKMDPLLHYLNSGGFEGRDPGPNFSSAWYLDTYADVKNAGNNPLVHYLRYGRQEGRLTQSAQMKQDLDLVNSSDLFDPDWYLANYPDIAEAKMDPYQHYQQAGKFEGRLALPPKFETRDGFAEFDPSKDTVLVVSHEASRSGAPILCLNIIQHLQKKYNVVSILLGDGAITEYFRDASTLVLGPMPGIDNPALVVYAIEQVTKSYKIKFAIVNSIKARGALRPLAMRFVPTISLIHEFAAYIRPRGAFLEAALWANEVIFSASLTHENAVSEYPELASHFFHIIPQGQCAIPFEESDTAAQAQEDARVLRALRPEGLPADTVVVLGVGAVTIRKGVDLFFDCAARLAQSGQGKNFRFVWIGKGYDPELDMKYSVYLTEQIQRSGLQDHVCFLGETSSLDVAYNAADIFLLSSRLDTLPNVAIDAIAHGLPLVCFEKTTGIADILIANGLGEECVAPYLDTVKMADKAMAFAQSKSLSQRVREQLRQVALKEFDMGNYVSQLEQIGLASSGHVAQEQADVAEIIKSGLARLDYFMPLRLQMLPDEAIRYYVRMWASGVIGRRKPFPGFHPGIFLEQHELRESGCDPFANYLRAGQPAGPWRYDVITSEGTAQPLPPELRIALHLHVYYPDLLPEMLKRLNGNQVRPDLFVSVPTESVRDEVQSVLLQRYSGKVIEIKVVPNCGRDIGPFLTAFGAAFVDRYDVVGHLHTKKTADVQDDRVGNDWYLFLLENLLGGKSNMADIILEQLATDPSIGIIFPDDPNAVGWGHNRSYAEALGQRLGLIALPENILFPVGTMFWARVESLLPIFNLGLDWQDYPTEPLPYDGSILHALERLLPLVVSSQGFRSVLTNVTGISR